MRILIDPGIYNLLNVGGVAMFQICVERLRALWPDAVFAALTDDPHALEACCPGVRPVPHAELVELLADRYLLGSLHQRLPGPLSRGLVSLKQRGQRQFPRLVAQAVRSRIRLGGGDPASFNAFQAALERADLVVISGAAGLNDSFPGYAREVCTMLEHAAARGIPAALFGQGLGPLHKPQLRARVGAALRTASLVAVREPRAGPPLLESLGVPRARVLLTGDDAIELAYRERPAALGDAIGVNLRLAAYTGVGHELLDQLRLPLQQFARAKQAALLPAPIALHAASPDHEAIRALLAGYDDTTDGGRDLVRPRDLVRQIGRCRLMVTGAYHAAVFALAQGIPAVCVAQSALYADKFFGLAAQFPGGCTVLELGTGDPGEQLQAAMALAWAAAPQLRPALLGAAAQQIAQSQAAYGRLRSCVAGPGLAATA